MNQGLFTLDAALRRPQKPRLLRPESESLSEKGPQATFSK
jgi:hypothetical protein